MYFCLSPPPLRRFVNSTLSSSSSSSGNDGGGGGGGWERDEYEKQVEYTIRGETLFEGSVLIWRKSILLNSNFRHSKSPNFLGAASYYLRRPVNCSRCRLIVGGEGGRNCNNNNNNTTAPNDLLSSAAEERGEFE